MSLVTALTALKWQKVELESAVFRGKQYGYLAFPTFRQFAPTS
jgi:hypothetical protein